MSTIKITGVSANKFFNQAHSALEKFTSSKITKKSKIRKFITDLLNLENEHLINTAFDSENLYPKNENRALDLSETKKFTVQKQATFEYKNNKICFLCADIKIQVPGLDENLSIHVNVNTLKTNPFFPPINSSDFNEETIENYRAAMNYALDLAIWINGIKYTVEANYLEAEGWIIKPLIFGDGVINRMSYIDTLKEIPARKVMVNKNQIEADLLELAGTNIDHGYYHDDVVKAVEKFEPIFGNKFNQLKIKS